MEKVIEYFEVISELNPKPVHTFEKKIDNQYIYPDILCTFDDNIWKVEMNDDWVGKININPQYIKFINESNDELAIKYVKEKLNKANFLIESIERRRKTILDTTKYIVNFQTESILYKKPLKSLIISQISNDLDMNISTVSRAIKNKYIQCDFGTYLLKDLLCKPIKNVETSKSKILQNIKEMIMLENKNHPLSDSEIVSALNIKDIAVSRRTVSKYRDILSIQSSMLRRTI